MTRSDLPHAEHHHRAPVQYYAVIMGLVFLLIGVLGFIPGANVMHARMHHDLAVTASQGHLLGLFPVNVLHNLVHLLFGVWGVAAFASFTASRGYARSVAIIYAIFTIMGLLPVAALQTTFGLVPLYGNDIWLHALIAIVAAAFGWAMVSREDLDYTHRHTPRHA